ncbi:ATP-binding protein [Nocardioides sp. AE5]|uniref:ATP-binding protein n=1 Tax=Nocardioides sp. AE5 TaxID=2962573 RepID=UPI002882C92F|nr:ATP-binding protein [Nocardioides sp. AE5]MDT0200773.1 ATP-binding protein [Nocardioides sp. AE5]
MSAPLAGIVARRITPLLNTLSAEEPVIALHGPRAVGKSTILHTFAKTRGVPVVDLDDPAVREAVLASPAAAVGQHTPLCLDEYQHAPDLLDALKARLNREGSRPGTAVLTGSTRQDALPRTAQALTGRLHSMKIWPLSQGEMAGVVENLLPAFREDPEATVLAHPSSSTTRSDYISRVCAGGFPLAVSRTPAARNRWFDDYVTQSVERDALELVRIRQRQVLRELLNRLAGRTGQVLNLSNAVDGLGVERKTADEYTKLLEDLFLIARLPAWGKTLRARATSSPKVHVVDSGLAARLLRLTPEKMASLDPTALTEFGNLLETFVVGELRKQVSWLEEQVTVGHWRTHDGDEVDFVVEFDDGTVLAFEVKAAERIPGKDFAGLRKLRNALGDRFIAGVALSAGQRSFNYEDRLYVMPIDRLWTPID